jgi:hypothetical protein
VFTARYGLNEDLCNKPARSYSTQKATAHYGLPFEFLCLNARLLARSQQASGRSCDLPYRHRFSVLDLGTRAGYWYGGRPACFPTLPRCCPPNTKLSPYSSLTPSAAFSQQSISHHATVFTSQRFALFLAYIHQKDEWALRRDLKTRIILYCHPTP